MSDNNFDCFSRKNLVLSITKDVNEHTTYVVKVHRGAKSSDLLIFLKHFKGNLPIVHTFDVNF